MMRRWYVWVPISLGLLALLVWRTRPWDALAVGGTLDPVPLVAALALNVVVVAAWAERSASLMAAVGSPLAWTGLIPVVSFANTVNNLTPASSGEVLRAMILHRRYGIPYGNAAAVILVERLWAIGIMLLTAVAASVGALTGAQPQIVAIAWIAAVAGCFLPSIAYSAGLRPGRAAAAYASGRPPGRLQRIAHHLVTVDDRLTAILTKPARSLHFVLNTFVVFLAFAGQLWLVLSALGANISLEGAWAAYGLAIVAGVISALPFGLGATDVVLVVLLGAQGVDAATAGAAVLLLRLVATLPMGLLGTASWVWLQRSDVSPVGGPGSPGDIRP